jgi:DtxR family Mn-dependent transcriptional regulator
MRDSISPANEDYLKTIHDLTRQQEVATTSQIAERLNITPASVTGMLKKLASSVPPLVVYHKHRGANLTEEGEKIALEIIRHHRLLELFLHETLGYSWDEVDEEADRLEHVISEDFVERIAAALGDPVLDPHGDPIPTRDLYLPPHATVPLRDLRPGQEAIVRRVRDTNPELLRYLGEIDVVPQAHIKIVDYSPIDGNIHLQLEDRGETIVLGPRITKQIFVEVL